MDSGVVEKRKNLYIYIYSIIVEKNNKYCIGRNIYLRHKKIINETFIMKQKECESIKNKYYIYIFLNFFNYLDKSKVLQNKN